MKCDFKKVKIGDGWGEVPPGVYDLIILDYGRREPEKIGFFVGDKLYSCGKIELRMLHTLDEVQLMK